MIYDHSVMKIYVAGAWTHREELRKLMDDIEQLGHTITHDWTSNELEYNDYHERSVRCARADIKGVCDADLVIAVMTDDLYQYKGTRHELGAAFALKYQAEQDCEMGRKAWYPSVWIVSNSDPRVDNAEELPGCMRCCFEHLADEYFRDIPSVLNKLRL